MHTWTTTLTKGAIQKAYPSLGTLKRVLVTRRDGNGDWYGRVEQMKLDGSKADVTLTGDAFRSKFGLRSSWFHFGSGSSAPGADHRPRTRRPRRSTAAGWRSAAPPRWSDGRRARSTPSPVAAPSASPRAASSTRPALGAHEEFGRVLTVYVRRGAATSKLGFPLTRPQRAGKRVKARFEHGTISVRRHGKPRAIVTFTS